MSDQIIQVDAGHCRRLCPKHTVDDPGDASRPAVQVNDKQFLTHLYRDISCDATPEAIQKCLYLRRNKIALWCLRFCPSRINKESAQECCPQDPHELVTHRRKDIRGIEAQQKEATGLGEFHPRALEIRLRRNSVTRFTPGCKKTAARVSPLQSTRFSSSTIEYSIWLLWDRQMNLELGSSTLCANFLSKQFNLSSPFHFSIFWADGE